VKNKCTLSIIYLTKKIPENSLFLSIFLTISEGGKPKEKNAIEKKTKKKHLSIL
jgi:hypothetical protein